MIKSYVLLISLPFLLLVQGCATTQSRLKDPFTESIYLIQENHIDEHDMKELVFKAVANIENIIDSNKYDIEKIEIDWGNANNDYISVSQSVYDHYAANSGDHAKDLFYGSLTNLLQDLDPASYFLKPSVFEEMKINSNVGGIGIQIRMIEDSPVILGVFSHTPAERAGIKPGDIITQIDGTLVQGFKLIDIVSLLRGPLDSTLRIKIIRDNADQDLQFEMKRERIKIPSIYHEFVAPKIAYIIMKQFSFRTGQELLNALDSMKDLNGLILDLRDNPGGLLRGAVDISDIFLERELTVVTIKGRNLNNRNQNGEAIFRTYSNKTRSDYPMIVLVNHQSAAASEIVAGALQTYKRALILGTTTFGRGSVQTVIPIRDGSALRLTTANIYLADGSALKSDGIHPDIIIKEDESSDSDNQLDTAIRLIKRAEGLKSYSAITEMLNYYKLSIAGFHI